MGAVAPGTADATRRSTGQAVGSPAKAELAPIPTGSPTRRWNYAGGNDVPLSPDERACDSCDIDEL